MIRARTFIPIAFALLSVPALAALSVGAKAPGFSTIAAKAGKSSPVSLAGLLRKGPVVLYFYPAAFTPGCTLEANGFADAIPQFRKLGATVLGASADDIATLRKFSKTECRKKFAVAVASPQMIADYDVPIPNKVRSNRTSYVIAPDGRIIYSYSSPDYRAHVPNTLKALQEWRAAKR